MLSQLRQEIDRHLAVEAELRTLLADQGDAVIAADAAGHVTFMNPVAESLTEWPEAQAKGRALAEIFRCVTPDMLLTRSDAQILIELRTAPLDRGSVGGVVLVFRRVPLRESSEGFQDRARSITKLERAADRATLLQEVTEACSEASVPAAVAAVVVTRGSVALGALRGFMYLLTEDGAALELVQVTAHAREVDAALRRFPMDCDVPITQVIRTEEALFFESTEVLLSQYPHLAGMQDPGDEALAILPLLVDGRALGALGFVFGGARLFDAEERDFLPTLARQCALALDRARLFEVAAHARAAAEAADRAKDDFLATLSHELRTPLTAILGWAHILRTRAPAPGERGRALQVIERNAHALVQLIEDILDVSRLVAGELHLELQSVDPAAIIRDAIDVARPSAEAKRITIEVAIEEGIGTLAADRARLRQITWNLLSNAIKFTPKGGRIEVRLDRLGAGVRLRVIDAGLGIDASFLPQVFDRFRQADSSKTRSHGGLGLGLAIVKHLVERHDGTVTAESGGVGLGATFTVTLPTSLGLAL